MIRGIVVVLILIGALALVTLAPNWLMTLSGDSASEEIPACHLLTESCSWQTDDQQWRVSLTRLADADGSPQFRLSLKTDANIERIHGILRGESMYLGEYPVLLRRGDAEGEWQGLFTPPVCTVQDIMVWRIDLEIPGNPSFAQPQRLLFEVQRR